MLPIFIAVPLFILGMGIFGLHGVEHSMSLLEPVPGGRQTTGIVVRYHESCNDSCTYQPTIEYRDMDGQARLFEAPYQSEYPAVGSKVKVSYDPRVPADAHDISLSPSTWELPLGTMIFAAVLGGLATVGVVGMVIRILLGRARSKASPNFHIPDEARGS
jgi:hypothetical protein